MQIISLGTEDLNNIAIFEFKAHHAGTQEHRMSPRVDVGDVVIVLK